MAQTMMMFTSITSPNSMGIALEKIMKKEMEIGVKPVFLTLMNVLKVAVRTHHVLPLQSGIRIEIATSINQKMLHVLQEKQYLKEEYVSSKKLKEK